MPEQVQDQIPKEEISRRTPYHSIVSVSRFKWCIDNLVEKRVALGNDPSRVRPETILQFEDAVDDLARLGVATLARDRRPENYQSPTRVDGKATLYLPFPDFQEMYAIVDLDSQQHREEFKAKFIGSSDYKGYNLWYREALSSERALQYYPHDAVVYELELVGFEKQRPRDPKKLVDHYPPLIGEHLPKDITDMINERITSFQTEDYNISEAGFQRILKRIEEARQRRTHLFY